MVHIWLCRPNFPRL